MQLEELRMPDWPWRQRCFASGRGNCAIRVESRCCPCPEDRRGLNVPSNRTDSDSGSGSADSLSRLDQNDFLVIMSVHIISYAAMLLCCYAAMLLCCSAEMSLFHSSLVAEETVRGK